MAATASSGNPWKSNNDPKDFVGCKIEIISNSDIRYVGTLYTFDPHASTISLKDVQSYGTESRRSGDQNVAPSNELYEYIVFRISDIKDLCVCEPPSPNSRRLSLVDSAIVNASDESQQSRSSNGFPRIRYTQEFLRSVNANNPSWNENRGRSGSANNMSTSSGNLGSVGGPGNGQSNRNAGQQGNNRNGQSQNNNSGNGNGGGFRGGRGGRGGNRGGMSGRGGGNGNNRRGAPVFPYPTQAGPQDWLTRYQKDMNLKAEFQNVNPDLSVLANIASSNELPADKVRDMMEGNWEAFLTAAELPGKTERAPTNAKAEFKDGFFDSLTAPPPTPSETMYNRRKDYETFGPANNNNNNNGPSNNSGRYNNNNNRQNGNQNQQQQSTQTGRWGNNNNQGYNNQRQQQSADGYSQGYGGRNNGGNAGNYNNNNNNGRYSGNNNNNRGGRGPQRGGYVNQRGGQQRGYGGNLNSLLSGMNNGGGFTQRDLVIPAQSSNGSSNWTFNQRTQAALWTPAVGLDLTQQPSVSATTWTFACNSPSSISESGYDALSPSPVD